ncbi:MAG: AAA family ATPase [Myxococcales bacterium]
MPLVPRLRRLRIEGFRRIQQPLELSFLDPAQAPVRTKLLAGPNGCGKTSILEALLLGLGEEHLIVRDLPKSARGDHWRTALPPGARIEVEASIDDKGPFTWYRTHQGFGGVSNALSPFRLFGHAYETTGGYLGPPLPLLQRTEERLAVGYFSSWRAPALVGPLRPLGQGNRPRDTEENRLYRLKQYLIDEKASSAFTPQAPRRDEGWLAELNEAWSLLHGGDGTRLDVQLVDPGSKERDADVFLLEPDGARRCSVDRLSSGEIELLSFAGWIVLNDFRAGLLVIDEPELHLHPQWQGAILPALRRLAPEVQLVVATHADAPWDQAMTFERQLLVPESDPRALRAGSLPASPGG